MVSEYSSKGCNCICFRAASQYDPNALKNLDVLDKMTTKKALTLADISPVSGQTSMASASASASAASTPSSTAKTTPIKPVIKKQPSKEALEAIALCLDTCTNTLVSGWLSKKPRRLGLAKKKWVKLCADPSGKRFMLFYFKAKDELKKNLGGSLPITGLCELEPIRSNDLVLTLESGRKVHFVAKTGAEREKWMSSLQDCISKGDKNWAAQYLDNHNQKSLNSAMDVMKNFLLKVFDWSGVALSLVGQTRAPHWPSVRRAKNFLRSKRLPYVDSVPGCNARCLGAMVVSVGRCLGGMVVSVGRCLGGMVGAWVGWS